MVADISPGDEKVNLCSAAVKSRQYCMVWYNTMCATFRLWGQPYHIERTTKRGKTFLRCNCHPCSLVLRLQCHHHAQATTPKDKHESSCDCSAVFSSDFPWSPPRLQCLAKGSGPTCSGRIVRSSNPTSILWTGYVRKRHTGEWWLRTFTRRKCLDIVGCSRTQYPGMSMVLLRKSG